METILTILAVGTLNVACFFIGAKVGQKVVKGETIETPNLNPLDLVRAEREKREAQREKDKYNTILENVEKYDGTEAGQTDVPR